MNSAFEGKVVGLLAALVLASSAFAAPPLTTAQAPDMLQQIHDDAYQVRDEADQLTGYDQEPNLIDWRMHADILQNMKYQINDMDQALHRLRDDEAALPKHDRAEVNRIAPALVELTDTAQDAIDFLSNNKNLLWEPRYTAYVDEMYSEAGRVEHYSLSPAPSRIEGAKVNHSTGTLNPSNGS